MPQLEFATKKYPTKLDIDFQEMALNNLRRIGLARPVLALAAERLALFSQSRPKFNSRSLTGWNNSKFKGRHEHCSKHLLDQVQTTVEAIDRKQIDIFTKI